MLGSLLEATADRVRSLADSRERLSAAAGRMPRVPGFAAALVRDGRVGLIAEIKRRSPSKGDLSPTLDAADQARAFASGGAAAISVLTEPTRFGGSLRDLEQARSSGVPLLRKDFIIDELQLLEAAASGASAVLLIARALPPERIAELHAAAAAVRLEVLVEIRDEAELDAAVRRGYPLVGVNNRNLETLAIDDEVSARLLPLIPSSVVAVYESGVSSQADVLRAADLGADAVLVGSALSLASDPAAAVRALVGVPARGRRAS